VPTDNPAITRQLTPKQLNYIADTFFALKSKLCLIIPVIFSEKLAFVVQISGIWKYKVIQGNRIAHKWEFDTEFSEQ